MTLRNTGLKLIIAFVVVILAVLVFNAYAVYATDDTDLQNILDKIPDTISVDISEAEYNQASKYITSNINEELAKNGIDANKLKDDNIEINGGLLLSVVDERNGQKILTLNEGIKEDRIITKGTISVRCTSNNLQKSKDIKIKYNNSDKYNTTVANSIKDTVNSNIPDYYVIDLDKHMQGDLYHNLMCSIEEYYSNVFNDKSMKFLAHSRAGDAGPFIVGFGDLGVAVFKDDIYYGTFNVKSYIYDKIVIPSSVSNTSEAFINYALPKVENVCNDVKLWKGKTISIKAKDNNIYDVCIDGIAQGNVILEKEKVEETKPTEVTNIDTTTKIKLDTTTEVVPAGTTLVAEKVTSGTSYNTVVKAVEKDVSKFEMYDISLMNNNAKIQPNGKVKVSIPVPSGFDASKIVVYRVADDGTKTKLDANVKDGYVVFETDHFSNYVVAEQATSTENTNTDTTETKTENKNTDRELDNTPKTGEETNVISVVATIVSVISALGLAVIKKF